MQIATVQIFFTNGMMYTSKTTFLISKHTGADCNGTIIFYKWQVVHEQNHIYFLEM